MAEVEKKQRTLIGRVTSNKMEQTIVVLTERRVPHRLYKKIMTHSNKVHAHDEKNECSIGDTVKIAETTPRSKTKAWELVAVIEKAK